MAAGPPPPQPPVQEPPPLVPLRYRPGPRTSRPRSSSLAFEVDLPRRPGTVPIPQPVPPRAPFQPHRRRAARPPQFGPPPFEAEGEGQYPPPVVPTGHAGPEGGRQPRPPSDIDFWTGFFAIVRLIVRISQMDGTLVHLAVLDNPLPDRI
ncbi:hypothetical protein SCP_1800900 [Sparassis crispa]|nr:hypothetical protein SCP_1800900 [Sparassis crispa]GBE90068.1 hypothetical protein SCP_1800900 [Sparassis crispa]